MNTAAKNRSSRIALLIRRQYLIQPHGQAEVPLYLQFSAHYRHHRVQLTGHQFFKMLSVDGNGTIGRLLNPFMGIGFVFPHDDLVNPRFFAANVKLKYCHRPLRPGRIFPQGRVYISKNFIDSRHDAPPCTTINVCHIAQYITTVKTKKLAKPPTRPHRTVVERLPYKSFCIASTYLFTYIWHVVHNGFSDAQFFPAILPKTIHSARLPPPW